MSGETQRILSSDPHILLLDGNAAVSLSTVTAAMVTVNGSTIAGLAGQVAGKVDEAPIDGIAYVRKDAGWVPESAGGGDTDTVVNVSTVPGVTCSDALESAYALAGGKVGEAPSDNRTYGRRNAAWVDTYRGQVVTASGTAAAGFQTIHTFVLAVGQDPIMFRLECEFRSSADSGLHGVLVAEGSAGRGSASATASIMPRVADNVPGTQTASVLVAGPNVQVRMSFGATACNYKARLFFWPWDEVT